MILVGKFSESPSPRLAPPKNYRQLHPQLRELKPILINHQWTNIYICKRRYIANKWEINGIESNPLILQIRQDDRLISTNLGELPNGLTRLREGS